MRLWELLFAFNVLLVAKARTEENPYLWKRRVVRCSPSQFQKQSRELAKNTQLSVELKLLLLKSNKVKGCELVGLDGSVKQVSKEAFKLKELERTINKMPMRINELEAKRPKN